MRRDDWNRGCVSYRNVLMNDQQNNRKYISNNLSNWKSCVRNKTTNEFTQKKKKKYNIEECKYKWWMQIVALNAGSMNRNTDSFGFLAGLTIECVHYVIECGGGRVVIRQYYRSPVWLMCVCVCGQPNRRKQYTNGTKKYRKRKKKKTTKELWTKSK